LDPISTYKLNDGIQPMMNINFPLLDFSITQSVKIMTFDAVLGYIGGIYAIIWAFFGCLVQNYNSFNKDMTLISNFYTTEDKKMIHILGRDKTKQDEENLDE
jgi:hypothetical protein